MQLLSPYYPPIALNGSSSWADCFLEALQRFNEVRVVTGYASENALQEIVNILATTLLETSALKKFDFILGMAFFDGLTERQKVFLSQLDGFLARRSLGHVYVPTRIAVHTKCSVFQSDKEGLAIVGSTNFTALLPTRQSELDLTFTADDSSFKPTLDYIDKLIASSHTLDSHLLAAIPTVKSDNTKLMHSKHSKTFDESTKQLKPGGLKFHLPIKTQLKSNMNKFNAAPRGRIPRSWYEVEIIVPTSIQQSSGFPSKALGTDKFRVYTDDGFSFDCHVSGGSSPRFNKNLESTGDLKVLGYWLKGKLLSSGVINEGDFLDERCLRDYGREFLTMSELTGDNEWFLDFGRAQ